MKVLLVTNDSQYRLSMRQLLTHEGFDVSIAKDAREAGQILKANEIDLVITEFNLSFMDGLTFQRSVREIPRNADIPFIIVYNHKDDTAKFTGEQSDRCTFVAKTIPKGQMTELVLHVISGGKQGSPISPPSPKQHDESNTKKEISAPPETPPPAVTREKHYAARILLVDDEDNFRTMLRDTLEDEGYKDISMAADGAEAIECLKRERFDLVVLDIIMPVVSGFGVLHFLHDHSPSTKVIMLTAYADIKLAVEAKALGAADFIAKPIMRTDFFRTIETVLSE